MPLGPVAKRLDLRVGQFRVMVQEGVGLQRHGAVADLVGQCLKFFHLPLPRVGAELREVQLAPGVIDVAGEPPPDGLHLRVPRVASLVRMAVVAGGLEDLLHRGRRRITHRDVILAGEGRGRREVPCGPEGLQRDKNHGEPEEDFCFHAGGGRRCSARRRRGFVRQVVDADPSAVGAWKTWRGSPPRCWSWTSIARKPPGA